MSSQKGDTAPSKEVKEASLKVFLAKLRKRHIIETLAAFIGGGWLVIEVVERLLVSHYHFPEETIDLTVISIISALLCTLIWRWFRGTEKRPGNVKVEVLIVPLIILVALAIDLNLILQMAGIQGKELLIGIIVFLLGIAWVIFKLSQWATGMPESGKKEVKALSPVAANHEKSIVVLPFKNMSADPEQEYFCEGIAEELINALAQIKGLQVIARTSAFSFKGKDLDIREIGGKLNVETALEGSVRKSGQRLRIAAQLVNVEDGYHIWSAQFDREMKDIFAIQEEISLIIVDNLKLKLLKEEKEKIFKRHTDDYEAYNLYLRGRYFWYRRYEGGLQKGLMLFQQAVEKDPLYALAYVGIADSFGVLGLFSFIRPDEAYPRAKAAAEKALEIDPELAEAHASLGWISMHYDWDWQAAEKEFRRAIKTNPDYAPAHLWYGMCLGITGRFDVSIDEMKKAQELGPLEPLINAMLGWSLYMARRFEESIEQNRKVIEMEPNFSIVYWYQIGNLAAMKMWDEAIQCAQKVVQLSGGAAFALGALGFAYGSAGMRDQALNALERLNDLAKVRYASPFHRASVYVGLGEKDKAFENLEKAYTDRESMMAYLGTWPFFDSVRLEPRFKVLLKKMNLE
jgi:TolB-like protein/Tfp pilus assembly protein PilF